MTARGLRVLPRHLPRLAAADGRPRCAWRTRAASSWAGAVMATPRGLDDLADGGLRRRRARRRSDANDLVLAVRARGRRRALEAALDAGRRGGSSPRAGRPPAHAGAERPPRSIARGGPRRSRAPTSPSSRCPGEYAALEAHHALTVGLHVLLFSDNVPLEEEVELKDAGQRLGLLVMGPGAGTAMLGRDGPGLRQRASAHREPGRRCRRGRRAPGRRRSSALLDRWGVGGHAGDRRRRAGPLRAGRRADGAARRARPRRRPGDRRHPARVQAAGRRSGAATVLGRVPRHPGRRRLPRADELRDGPAGHARADARGGAPARRARLVGAAPPAPGAGLRDAVATAPPGTCRARADRRPRPLLRRAPSATRPSSCSGGCSAPVYSNEPLRAGAGPARARRRPRAARPRGRGVHAGRGRTR